MNEKNNKKLYTWLDKHANIEDDIQAWKIDYSKMNEEEKKEHEERRNFISAYNQEKWYEQHTKIEDDIQAWKIDYSKMNEEEKKEHEERRKYVVELKIDMENRLELANKQLKEYTLKTLETEKFKELQENRKTLIHVILDSKKIFPDKKITFIDGILSWKFSDDDIAKLTEIFKKYNKEYNNIENVENLLKLKIATEMNMWKLTKEEKLQNIDILKNLIYNKTK